MSAVGIHGIGVYLPPQIRRNDWWPDEIVSTWRQASAGRLQTMASLTEGRSAPSPGVARVLGALAELRDDPFQGARARHVAPDDMPSSEMETRAARDAIARAKIDPAEIDFVLSYSACPDYLMAPNACAVHHALGLSPRCLALANEGTSNTFLLQLVIAEQMIRSGAFRAGLLVQSSNMTRFLPREQPASAVFGDGATAVVVGAVSEGHGVLGSAHRTNGANFRALVVGVPGGRWYDGRPVFYVGDPARAADVLLGVADHCKEVVDEALARAQLRARDVAYYACHQGAAWLRRVTQEFVGLDRARGVDTFPWATSLSAVNIPLGLAIGEREGLLSPGDAVVAFSGGSGETWSSVVMRWGRG